MTCHAPGDIHVQQVHYRSSIIYDRACAALRCSALLCIPASHCAQHVGSCRAATDMHGSISFPPSLFQTPAILRSGSLLSLCLSRSCSIRSLNTLYINSLRSMQSLVSFCTPFTLIRAPLGVSCLHRIHILYGIDQLDEISQQRR